ncbi:MAG: hypothetical protein ACRES9_10085 [Gammaproteobacteria bacterium]
MNYRVLALIGARLLAIWLVVLGISALPQLAEFWHFWNALAAKNHSGYFWLQSGYVLTVIIPVILGIVLWAFAPWLSRWMAPKGKDTPPAVAGETLVQGAIAIAGLVLFVNTFPHLIYRIVSLIQATHSKTPFYGREWVSLAEQIVLLVLALALIVGARRLREWIFRLRTAASD